MSVQHVPFSDRDDAGRQLGAALKSHAEDRPVIVLALPRGGVPVAARVAQALGAPLDVYVVRKLGVPGHDELAMGAIASGGACTFNEDVIVPLGIVPWTIEHVIQREVAELRRREISYRGDRRYPRFIGETVIVVDDGAATGSSMRVAIDALREMSPRAIIAAVPVASPAAGRVMRAAADACVTLIEPEPFHSVGHWYSDFSEVTDDEVRAALSAARSRWAAKSVQPHAGARQ